jgi:predicted short-subunit dehydrogenase-like oxidoreductase (DUF2520 family)
LARDGRLGVVKLVRADPAGLERYGVPSTSPQRARPRVPDVPFGIL